jgi:hypothetical protein
MRDVMKGISEGSGVISHWSRLGEGQMKSTIDYRGEATLVRAFSAAWDSRPQDVKAVPGARRLTESCEPIE